MDTPQLDTAEVEAFATRAIADLAASYTGVMVSLGSKLGLYRALAGAGPLSAHELAARAGCAERYVREWLNAQAACGYLVYHAASETYELTPEHALVLADEDSVCYVPPAWNMPAAMWADEAKSIEAFRTGRGVAWGEHDGRMACGVAAFYRNGYRAALVPQWLPALDGVVDRLQDGIAVADVGCGHGHSTLLMARAFPNSRFYGFDPHPASIEAARRNARAQGLDGRVHFEEARATDYRDEGYGLVCFFDALHDMGDPVGAVRHAAATLAEHGTVMLVEPFAHDRAEDNFTLTGHLYYGASAVICCAHAISEGGRLVLGAQAGPARLAGVCRKAGLTHFRVAAQTPFNLICEVRR
ncbi:MAG TPA: class I SAM-dependent methyltransferase [Gemmatimonadales bacterium]|nr:class I SAM-dependent methyltransferase [Gemmatimonadales bacterium]